MYALMDWLTNKIIDYADTMEKAQYLKESYEEEGIQRIIIVSL